MHNENHSTDTTKKGVIYTLSRYAIGLVLISVMTWFVIATMVARKFEIISTQLILKSESCTLMNHEKIHTTNISDQDYICSINIPFLANKIGNGGIIFIADRQIKIADNQIVASEISDIQSWTDEQIKAVMLIMVSTAFLLASAVWFFSSNFERK